MEEKEIIVFFFPWHEVSGGPFYLGNLADSLADDDRYEVYYSDYENGLSDQIIDNPKVKKLVYFEPYKFPIGKPVTLITPIYSASHIPKLPADSKILFFNWHNYCIQSLIDIWKINDKDLQKFLKMVHDTHSVFFLDEAHREAQNEWVSPKGAYQFAKQYIPITIQSQTVFAKSKLIKTDEINIAILGRLCNDKVWSVLNLLDQLEAYKCKKRKNVYIIGDGENTDLVANRQVGNNINLIMTGTVVGNNLKKMLANKVDILFAMGRSVLESSAMKMPSVIIPHNIHAFTKDAYVYLQDTKGYALGWYDTQIDDLDIPHKTLAHILDDIYIRGEKQQQGEKAFQYVKKHHFTNVEELKDALSKTTLTYRRFWKIAKKQSRLRILGMPLVRISTTMDESQKIASLFGKPGLCSIKLTPNHQEFWFWRKQRSWLIVLKEDERFRLFLRLPIIKV